MTRLVLVVLVVLTAIAAPCVAQIIDHNDIARVSKLPQSVMDGIGGQKWFFTHASVGGNMIDGLNDLHTANPTRYQLVPTSAGATPPSSTVAGRVYEYPRGNPGWSEKFTIFNTCVSTNGWRWNKIDAAMDKLCYIDQNANVTTYLNMMSALETSYPDTVLVYTTMPLTTDMDSNNVLRNQYNTAVRSYCVANKKLLYDIADIEAWDPNGVQQTFQSGGQTYQKLYSGYTSDGGHLNTTGRQRVATGWYAAAAAIVPMGLPGHAACDWVFWTASSNFRFATWGSVTVVDADTFKLDDGSHKLITVIAKGHGLSTGDYARAAGVLDASACPPTIRSCAHNVKKLN